MNKETWGLSEVWNKSLEEQEQRPLSFRDHLWASELGKAPVDLWLKLRAVPPTNPPNPRSLRKFEAGNVFEWIVSLILKRAGILKESQRWSSYQYPGLMKVTGKADFIAGGKPDIRMFEEEVSRMSLPNVFVRAGEKILNYIDQNFPDGLEEMPLEIKSVSAFAFEAMEKKNRSNRVHRLQAYHYLKSENRPRANIVYISRDDLRILEFPVLLNSETEKEYHDTIEALTKSNALDQMPPVEKKIVFEEDYGKFARNFNVGYSNYLTMLYGYSNQMEFEEQINPIVSQWNRVLGRLKAGSNVTEKNKLVLEKIKEAGFIVDEILSRFAVTKEEEEA